jgi:NitT/TauT family transport system ATP-binding protein
MRLGVKRTSQGATLDDCAVTASEQLVLDRVGISYPTRDDGPDFEAVKEVSFTVDPNEFTCVVGPSGCGKSTLLMAAAGLIPVSAGQIFVGDTVVRAPGVDRAVVFQAASLLPWRTVIGNVAYGLEIRHRKDARSRAYEMIELVGLDGAATKYPHELSGGMQQRANLARALAADPRLLLMDEPFAALDAQTRELMQAELLRVWSELRKTVLFITHQIEEAVFLGDQVVVLSKGPATVVREILRVDFPRPREEGIKRTPAFMEVVDHIWHLIRNG